MDSPEDTDGQNLPKPTTPTWEMEPPVSGGPVFGPMQLAGLVDDSFVSLYNRASEDFSFTLMPLWVYVKFVLVTLIGTYLVHLGLRGYWVALVGMNSVSPGGVDWRKLRIGPLSRQYMEKNTPTMATTIENVDNLATRVFGIGFGFAMTMLVPVVLAAISLVLGWAIKQAFDVENTRWVFAAVFAAVFLPWGLAVTIDQYWGSRIREGSLPYRMLQANFAFYERLGISSQSNPLISVFNSPRLKRLGLVFPRGPQHHVDRAPVAGLQGARGPARGRTPRPALGGPIRRRQRAGWLLCQPAAGAGQPASSAVHPRSRRAWAVPGVVRTLPPAQAHAGNAARLPGSAGAVKKRRLARLARLPGEAAGCAARRQAAGPGFRCVQ